MRVAGALEAGWSAKAETTVRERSKLEKGPGRRNRRWKHLGLEETCFVRSCKEARGSKGGEQRKSSAGEWSCPVPHCWLG